MKYKILTIDDEENIRNGLADNFELEGYIVKQASNGKDGLNLIKKGDIDLVITDLRMDGISGEEVVRNVVTENPSIPVIVLTGHGSIEDAAAAIKGRELAEQKKQLQSQLRRQQSFDLMIGKSSELNKVYTLISKVAPSKSTVLITGESGVGKEVAAKTIHDLSPRKDKSFIAVNCSAFPESLIESELFGHEKGAFTGADNIQKGKFELAHGGTLFLDEIGEINLSTQVKLLRVIQERKIERIGSENPIDIEVRIMSATNRNLEDDVKNGKFRQDLYYRLNVVRIEIPPLRKRKEDIPLLIHSFLKEFNLENEKNIKGFNSKAIAALTKYSWPGNIRELKNCVESTVVLCSSDEIKLEDLPPNIKEQSEENTISIPIGLPMSEIEKIVIQANLSANNGNKSKTADILGIGRKTLHRKLEELEK